MTVSRVSELNWLSHRRTYPEYLILEPKTNWTASSIKQPPRPGLRHTAGLMVVQRAVHRQLAPAGQCWCVICWTEWVCVISLWVWQHSCCWQQGRQLQRAGTRRTPGYVSTDSSSDSVTLLTGRDPGFPDQTDKLFANTHIQLLCSRDIHG